MLREEVLKIWNSLKQKFLKNREQGFSKVYGSVSLKRIHVSEESENSIYERNLGIAQEQVKVDRRNYNEQLIRMNEKIDNAERKLDRVKDLISENKIEKLKTLIKRGNI